MHVFASYVHVRARIMMKINIEVYRYTDSLSLNFFEDPFIGCGEIAKTKLSMHTYHFKCIFIYIQNLAHNLAHQFSKSKNIDESGIYMFQNLHILEKFCQHSESIKSNFILCNKKIVFKRTKETYCMF